MKHCGDFFGLNNITHMRINETIVNRGGSVYEWLSPLVCRTTPPPPSHQKKIKSLIVRDLMTPPPPPPPPSPSLSLPPLAKVFGRTVDFRRYSEGEKTSAALFYCSIILEALCLVVTFFLNFIPQNNLIFHQITQQIFQLIDHKIYFHFVRQNIFRSHDLVSVRWKVLAITSFLLQHFYILPGQRKVDFFLSR